MKRLRDDERGAVLLVVLVILAVLTILANGIARRQSYVWKLHRNIQRREIALNAARSGADVVLARIERGLPANGPFRDTIGRGSFEAYDVEGIVVSRGRVDAEPNVPEAVVRVRYRKTTRGIEITHWEEP